MPPLVQEFEGSLAVLRHGDPERPLFVPWDETVQARFAVIEQDWSGFRQLLVGPITPAQPQQLRELTIAFVAHIDAFVHGIETHISRWTAILHLLQTTLMALVVLGAVVLLYVGQLLVLEPVGLLKRAIEKIQGGDFDARVERVSSDEFGTLAEGFNDMAEHLQSMYRNLEAKVAEKTAELEEKRERLDSLYEVTALVARSHLAGRAGAGFRAQHRSASRTPTAWPCAGPTSPTSATSCWPPRACPPTWWRPSTASTRATATAAPSCRPSRPARDSHPRAGRHARAPVRPGRLRDRWSTSRCACTNA